MSSAAAVLTKKRDELVSDLARLKDEARAAGEAEVRDDVDAVTADQGTAEALEDASVESRTLEEVEDALKRVGNGTYGRCVICGRPIAPARLAAIPWTPYCLDDQEKRGR